MMTSPTTDNVVLRGNRPSPMLSPAFSNIPDGAGSDYEQEPIISEPIIAANNNNRFAESTSVGCVQGSVPADIAQTRSNNGIRLPNSSPPPMSSIQFQFDLQNTRQNAALEFASYSQLNGVPTLQPQAALSPFIIAATVPQPKSAGDVINCLPATSDTSLEPRPIAATPLPTAAHTSAVAMSQLSRPSTRNNTRDAMPLSVQSEHLPEQGNSENLLKIAKQKMSLHPEQRKEGCLMASAAQCRATAELDFRLKNTDRDTEYQEATFNGKRTFMSTVRQDDRNSVSVDDEPILSRERNETGATETGGHKATHRTPSNLETRTGPFHTKERLSSSIWNQSVDADKQYYVNRSRNSNSTITKPAEFRRKDITTRVNPAGSYKPSTYPMASPALVPKCAPAIIPRQPNAGLTDATSSLEAVKKSLYSTLVVDKYCRFEETIYQRNQKRSASTSSLSTFSSNSGLDNYLAKQRTTFLEHLDKLDAGDLERTMSAVYVAYSDSRDEDQDEASDSTAKKCAISSIVRDVVFDTLDSDNVSAKINSCLSMSSFKRLVDSILVELEPRPAPKRRKVYKTITTMNRAFDKSTSSFDNTQPSASQDTRDDTGMLSEIVSLADDSQIWFQRVMKKVAAAGACVLGSVALRYCCGKDASGKEACKQASNSPKSDKTEKVAKENIQHDTGLGVTDDCENDDEDQLVIIEEIPGNPDVSVGDNNDCLKIDEVANVRRSLDNWSVSEKLITHCDGHPSSIEVMEPDVNDKESYPLTTSNHLGHPPSPINGNQAEEWSITDELKCIPLSATAGPSVRKEKKRKSGRGFLTAKTVGAKLHIVTDQLG